METNEIHKTIKDALRAANAKFDTDGRTIWIDAGGRRTIAVCVTECEIKVSDLELDSTEVNATEVD